ncbi:hypothetical protein Asulf_01911 [Archaeoglobus sulfaticallidus PM70-1]|uniref:Uncharacterized protein n=1 Tax=Archaeoglobus sulfaticallidus PM70-1 TaxID=387631 RepID=N0BHU2_9EURY|nr:hypothetical protein [Archaeoglobus sulfaticallidus]AGK61877.1 hypothetical protein Asulf_01911 [Archaeoglobus sulfaticallidus PM70-1]
MSRVEELGYTTTPETTDLANQIMFCLVNKYSIEEIMDITRKNSSKNIYIMVSKRNPEKVSLFVDHNGNLSYCCDDPLLIPIPKKFAVLEPDKDYFEITLKANICLALMRASEKDLHR